MFITGNLVIIKDTLLKNGKSAYNATCLDYSDQLLFSSKNFKLSDMVTIKITDDILEETKVNEIYCCCEVSPNRVILLNNTDKSNQIVIQTNPNVASLFSTSYNYWVSLYKNMNCTISDYIVGYSTKVIKE